MKKKFCSVTLLALMLCLLLTSCSSSSTMNYNGDYNSGIKNELVYDDSYGSIDSAPQHGSASAPESGGQTQNNPLANRKLVKTVDLSCEVKDYDGFVSWVEQSVDQYAGYIENFSESQSQRYSASLYYSDYRNVLDDGLSAGYYMARHAYMTIRVPVQDLNDFLNQIGDNANITSRSSRQDDITLSYIDTESYIIALNTEQNRLLELMAQAENMTDIIAIESRLSEIRHSLESYNSQLKLMDNKIDYATIDLNISEVMNFTDLQSMPTGYFGRLWLSFKRGCVNTWDFLIELSFWISEHLVAFCLLGFVIYWVRKFMKARNIKLKLRRHRKNKPEIDPPASAEDVSEKNE